MNFLFQFKKFEPSDETVVHGNKVLSMLTEEAPNDSTISATVIKEEDVFICRLEIHSLSHRFFAEGKASEPHVSIDLAEAKIKEQLGQWRSERFGDPTHSLEAFESTREEDDSSVHEA